MEPERPLPALPSKSLLKGPPPLVYQPPNSPPEYRSNSQESVHASREDSLIDNTLVPSSNPSRRMKDTSTKTVEQKGEHSEHRQAHKAFRKFAYAIRVRENDTKTSGGNHTREHDHRHKAADFTSQDFSEHRESKPDVQETKKDLQEKEGIRHSLRSSEALSESQTSSDDLRKSRFAINAETPEALIGKLQLTNHNSFELITSLEAETDNLRQSVEEHKKLVEMKEDEIRKLKASIVDVRRKPAIHVESSRDEIKAEKEEEHAVVIDKLKHEKMFLAKTATIAKSKLQDNVKTMEIIAARYSKSEKELTNKMMDTKRELDMEREHSRKLEEMLQSHKETMESSKAKRAVLEEENAARARQHLQRQKKLLAELDEMREECKKAESNRKENEFRFRSQMNELIANHDDVLGKMQADFNASRAQLEARTSKEFEIEKISHLKEMDRSNEQIDKLKLTFELEKTSITEGTRQAYEDLRNLKRSSEVGKGSLLAELDGCYSALMEKDNFEPMPDREVHAKFFDLANDIEQLARLEWGKEHIKTSWFTQEFVSPVTPQRLVQKQLLQNVIWSILNKHIFGSPFRMFGDEGRKLEINWLQQSGTAFVESPKTYTWPPSSMETERWRYINVKECHAALTHPLVSEWDPRMKLMQGYIDSVAELKRCLAEVLSSVVDLNAEQTKAISKIAKKCSRVWLEFGMQRCRYVIIVPGLQVLSVEEQLRMAKEGPIQVTICPELKRFGNPIGYDLHSQTTLQGCEGTTQTLTLGEARSKVI